jgi:hypothetical protein
VPRSPPEGSDGAPTHGLGRGVGGFDPYAAVADLRLAAVGGFVPYTAVLDLRPAAVGGFVSYAAAAPTPEPAPTEGQALTECFAGSSRDASCGPGSTSVTNVSHELSAGSSARRARLRFSPTQERPAQHDLPAIVAYRLTKRATERGSLTTRPAYHQKNHPETVSRRPRMLARLYVGGAQWRPRAWWRCAVCTGVPRPEGDGCQRGRADHLGVRR